MKKACLVMKVKMQQNVTVDFRNLAEDKRKTRDYDCFAEFHSCENKVLITKIL